MAHKLQSQNDGSSEAQPPSKREEYIKLTTQFAAKFGEVTVWQKTAQDLVTELDHIEAMFPIITNIGLFETALEAFKECAKKLEDVQARFAAVVQELNERRSLLEEVFAKDLVGLVAD